MPDRRLSRLRWRPEPRANARACLEGADGQTSQHWHALRGCIEKRSSRFVALLPTVWIFGTASRCFWSNTMYIVKRVACYRALACGPSIKASVELQQAIAVVRPCCSEQGHDDGRSRRAHPGEFGVMFPGSGLAAPSRPISGAEPGLFSLAGADLINTHPGSPCCCDR